MTADKEILAPLVDRILELASRPQEAEKKKLWADHQALKPTDRIPISVYYEGIPYKQWELMFGAEFLKCSDDLACSIEASLRKRIWMADNVADDHIVWPTVIVNAPSKQEQDWGVDLAWKHSDDDLGAKGYDVPFKESIDMSVLTKPHTAWDKTECADYFARAVELIDNKLTVLPHYLSGRVNNAPFDLAVHMRGMENLLMDTVLAPEPIHELMNFITEAILEEHKNREELGYINPLTSEDGIAECGFRVHCSYLPDDFDPDKPRIADEWIYNSAQTSAGLGPEQYAEFVQPYNARITEMYPNKTVYYHGCECLDQKVEVIKDLPNLRRFHVSPWSSVARAVEIFQGSVVMEVHDHPGNTFFKSDEDQTAHIRELVKQAEGHHLDLNISDIHAFGDDPQNLIRWAVNARKATEQG